MFFRSYYSNKAKLSEKTINQIGCTCYSCQCSWKSVTDDYVMASKGTNWACAGH
ncbi:MAG: hypothetical protein MJ252_24105 [archaeon]|nr:hypothetical protein [archaeon]